MKIRTLIVDDESLARSRLQMFLSKEPDFEILGECTNGSEAIATIRSSAPDLVFLDMQMPGCDGLQVLTELPREKRPAIVFATAHERFAVEAFDHEAVDYLLKPFDQDRFRQALRRVRDFLRRDRAIEVPTDLIESVPTIPKVDRITVKVEGRLVFLKLEQIVRVEAADNYVWVHLIDKRFLIRETMAALEARLGSVDFVRVNRSAIVNLNHLKEIKPGARNGDHDVVLLDSTVLSLSRRLRSQLNRFIQ